MTDYEEMARELRGARGFESGSGVEESAVVEAEAQLGLLPHDYRQFLLDFGWSMFTGAVVWGLGKGFPYEKSFVQMTLEERADFGLPDTMVAFSNDGAGNLSCFVTSATGLADGRVFVFLHETRTAQLEADSFVAFMRERLSIKF